MKEAIAIAVQAGVPSIIWGLPGGGKTSFIYNLGKTLHWPTEVVIASIHDPSDFSGLPIPENHHVWYAPPDWAKRLSEVDRGILFLDELSTAAPATQAALLRVIFEGTVGSLALPKGVSVVAAANPPEVACAGWDLSAPLANRLAHFAWGVSANHWVRGTLAGWGEEVIPILPGNWNKTHATTATALVTSFIQTRPNLLLSIPKSESDRGRAWPSPRTWDFARKLLAAGMSVSASEDTMNSLISACVGAGPAIEFIQWHTSLDLPQPDEVMGMQNFTFPVRDDQTFAILGSVVAHTLANMTLDRWQKAWNLLAQATKQGKADLAVIHAQTLSPARPKGYPDPEGVSELIPVLVKAGLFHA